MDTKQKIQEGLQKVSNEKTRKLGAWLTIKLRKLDSNGNSLAGKSRDLSAGPRSNHQLVQQ